MSVESLRVTFRRQVRDRALDAAHELTVRTGWDQVRVGAIAEQIGVSRPTLYREFGNKEGLGEALVLREVERFLAAVAEVLFAEEPDVGAGVAAAVELTVRMADDNPLLHAALTTSRTGTESLLPFLTTRSEPLLTAATGMLATWFGEHHPELDQIRIGEAIDAVVRLVVSHLVLPTHSSTDLARILSQLATRYVGLSDARPRCTHV